MDVVTFAATRGYPNGLRFSLDMDRVCGVPNMHFSIEVLKGGHVAVP
jgi:hypothetical protein